MSPICLPDPSLESEGLTGLMVTGWWSSAPGEPTVSQTVQEVAVTSLTTQACSTIYPDSQLTDSMVCADDGEEFICQGSGGSPLVHLGQDGRYSQVGLMSWGDGCGDPRYPSVYTRLPATLDFINSQL